MRSNVAYTYNVLVYLLILTTTDGLGIQRPISYTNIYGEIRGSTSSHVMTYISSKL